MKKLLLALALLLPLPAAAAQLPYFSGPQDPALLQFYLNTLVQEINTLVTPNTNSGPSTALNYLDNGSMGLAQRGTGIQTCGTTTVPKATAYSADRWGCNANVTSGAGRAQVTTTVPAPPPGFQNSERCYRTSGSLTQPVCCWQEMPTAKATQLSGQSVVLSSYEQALAGLAADNASVTNLVIVTGTGSDEGLQSFTASPAITPAWTGIATPANVAATITTSWARYNTGPVLIPVGTTEIAVAACFTPTATGAGTTDGFAFTGVQLEVLSSGAAVPGPYQFKQNELPELLRYAYVISEPLQAGELVAGGGLALGTTTTCSITIPFPVVMRIAPTYTNTLSATTFTITSSSQAATALGTPFSATLVANSPNAASINFTTTGMTAKDACELTATAAGAGSMLWTADF